MIFVSKEYEIKTKMVEQEWLQLKMFLFFCWVELTFGGEGRGEWANFWAGGGTPRIPPVVKTLYTYIHIYIYICTYIYIHIYYTYIKELCQQVFIYNEEAPCTSHTCAKVAFLLLQDLSTLCVTVHMVYIFTCLFSVHNKIKLWCHEHV